MSRSPLASAGKKTGVGAGTCEARPGLAMRRHAMMLALLIASFAASERAQAKCDPPAGDNVTATCTGTTSNPNNGFGSGNNLNTTVVQGATVTGIANADSVGIFFNTGSMTNFGVISGIGGATATASASAPIAVSRPAQSMMGVSQVIPAPRGPPL